MGEIAAGKIGRRVGLDPGNVIEKFEAELLHGESDGVNDVRSAGNPDGGVFFQDALAGGEPGAVEFVVGVGALRFVPFAFVDGDHFSGVAGDAAVGEEVRRVGEDEVDRVVGNFFEELEAVTVIEADVVFGVVENGSGEIRRERAGNGFGHGELMINGDR